MGSISPLLHPSSTHYQDWSQRLAVERRKSKLSTCLETAQEPIWWNKATSGIWPLRLQHRPAAEALQLLSQFVSNQSNPLKLHFNSSKSTIDLYKNTHAHMVWRGRGFLMTHSSNTEQRENKGGSPIIPEECPLSSHILLTHSQNSFMWRKLEGKPDEEEGWQIMEL